MVLKKEDESNGPISFSVAARIKNTQGGISLEKERTHITKGWWKNLFLLSDAVFILGLLAFAIIFFTINKSLPPASGEYERRLFWRNIADNAYAICEAIYILGLILAIFGSVIKNTWFSLKTIAAYYAVQIVIMAVCILPFALLDRTWFYSYIFPLWSTLIVVSALFVISLLILVIRAIRKKN